MRSHRRTPTGIRVRHSRSCATSHGQQRCSCSPSYEASVYSAADGKKIRRVFPTLAAARSWRHDSATAVRRGAMRAPTATTLRESWEAETTLRTLRLIGAARARRTNAAPWVEEVERALGAKAG